MKDYIEKKYNNILMKFNVLLVRHGKSIWNHDSKFTGWTNIPLIEEGRKESLKIAKKLREKDLIPNIFFSSVLERSLESANIIKYNVNPEGTMQTSWRLNEKHYGTLEGIERKKIREEYGGKFTTMMRNNFYMKPPVIRDLQTPSNYPIFKNCYYNSIKYGESKENVLNRLLPYFQNDILYTITENKLPLVVTHKHCMRVLMKFYLNMNDQEFEEYDIQYNTILNMIFDENFDFQDYKLIKY